MTALPTARLGRLGSLGQVAARGFPGRFSIASLGWCYLNCRAPRGSWSGDLFVHTNCGSWRICESLRVGPVIPLSFPTLTVLMKTSQEMLRSHRSPADLRHICPCLRTRLGRRPSPQRGAPRHEELPSALRPTCSCCSTGRRSG